MLRLGDARRLAWVPIRVALKGPWHPPPLVSQRPEPSYLPTSHRGSLLRRLPPQPQATPPHARELPAHPRGGAGRRGHLRNGPQVPARDGLEHRGPSSRTSAPSCGGRAWAPCSTPSASASRSTWSARFRPLGWATSTCFRTCCSGASCRPWTRWPSWPCSRRRV